MTRQLLMITTAIVALAAAPAVQAEGTKASGSAKTTMSGQTTAGTKAKVMTQASAKKDPKGMRAQNAQEVEMTRALNRDSAAGRQVGQMSQSTMPGEMPAQGAALPQDQMKADEVNGAIGASTGANQ